MINKKMNEVAWLRNEMSKVLTLKLYMIYYSTKLKFLLHTH